jgi:hypothetical protein
MRVMPARPDGTATGCGKVRLGTALLVSIVSLLGGSARAAPRTSVALEYEIGAGLSGCPTAEEFQARVARQIGYDPFRPAADRRVAVLVGRKESGFDGRIRWSDAEGRWVGDRRLSSRRPDCADIAASLAFTVAVEIQLLAKLTRETPPTIPPEHAAPPPPQAQPSPAPTIIDVRPPPPPQEPSRLAVSVGLGPSLALGLAPEVTGLGRVFVAGRVARLSLELSLEAALPRERREVDGSGFSLERFAGGAAGCGHARWLAACLTATGGVLRVRGFGVDVPASPSGFFSQVGGRLSASFDLGSRCFATVRAEALVLLSSWTVTLNETAAWTTPRVGGLVGADLGAHIF